jgi:hypothetical protein
VNRTSAAGLLSGLVVFAVGFCVAAVAVLAGAPGSWWYLTAVGLGFSGIGLLGFHLNRARASLPPGPIWGREGLGSLATALGWPVGLVRWGWLALIAFGVFGNLIWPNLPR